MLGKLIAITGLSRTGKSTQARLLCKNLTAQGGDAIQVNEFSNSLVGRNLEKIIAEDDIIDQVSFTLQILAGNVDRLYRHILPGLKNHDFVVCDTYSNMVLPYQISLAKTLEEKNLITQLVEQTNMLFPRPALIFYLAAPLDVLCLRYIRGGGKNPSNFRSFVSGALDNITIEPNYIVVDAGKSEEAVAAEIFAEVVKL